MISLSRSYFLFAKPVNKKYAVVIENHHLNIKKCMSWKVSYMCETWKSARIIFNDKQEKHEKN